MSDFDKHALHLLKFIEDSIAEALANPAEMSAPLSEADGALRVLKKSLVRGNEDQRTLHAQLALIGAFDLSFVQIAKENPTNPSEKLKEGLACVLRGKLLFPNA
jgi:hypothetical protein